MFSSFTKVEIFIICKPYPFLILDEGQKKPNHLYFLDLQENEKNQHLCIPLAE